jgi:hypothetical protein
MTTTHRIVKWLLLIGALACLVWVFASVPAKAEEASPSPSPTPTITYPTAEQVAFAKTWHRRAVRERARLARVRACFRDKAPVRVGSLPLRGASAETWVRAGKRCRHLTRDWKAKRLAGMVRMKHPGGGGSLRWLPLVRWYWRGYPESTCYMMVHISWHESGGAEHRWNFGGSGAYGIWQLLPKPSWVWNAWTQAKAARAKFKADGFGPWAGCKAFTCGGGCGIK